MPATFLAPRSVRLLGRASLLGALALASVSLAPRNAGPCDHRLLVAESPDETPPTRAEIVEPKTRLVEGPEEAGAFSCGDTDAIRLVVAGTDDATPART